MQYTLTVIMSEDAESGVIDSLQGRGYEIELEDEDGDTGTYSLVCEPEDAPVIRRVLNEREDVVSFKLNPVNYDYTSTKRSHKRREKLNEIAYNLGYESWNKLVTDVINGKAEIVRVNPVAIII